MSDKTTGIITRIIESANQPADDIAAKTAARKKQARKDLLYSGAKILGAYTVIVLVSIAIGSLLNTDPEDN